MIESGKTGEQHDHTPEFEEEYWDGVRLRAEEIKQSVLASLDEALLEDEDD